MTQPSPAGRVVSVMVRMTEDGAAYIDKERATYPGKVSRAEFIRIALTERAGLPTAPKLPPPVSRSRLSAALLDAIDEAGFMVIEKEGGSK